MTMEFREDLPFLLNKMGLTNLGVEVGVLRGEFAAHILKYWKGKKLFCVDGWRHMTGLIDINNPDHNGHLDNMAKAFMAVYGFQGRATLLRELSLEAAQLFPNEAVDFVYLDAAHNYDNVRKDLRAWYPKIVRGGILCGHDYLDSKIEPGSDTAGFTEFGVKQAVDEFAKEHNFEVNVTQEELFPTWWITLP